MSPVQPAMSAAYEWVVRSCAPLSWEPPWDFLPGDPDNRSPVVDPETTLVALRRHFADPVLLDAGIAQRGPAGQMRLEPALCNPTGAIIALRAAPDKEPFALLAARGCLPRTDVAVLAALADGRTQVLAGDTGVLVGGWRIRDVALLRALGIPATLVTGLAGLDCAQLLALDRIFAGAPSPAAPAGRTASCAGADAAGTAASQVAAGGPHVPDAASAAQRSAGEIDSCGAALPPGPSGLAARATLAILGWCPHVHNLEMPPLLPRLARHLADVRLHLDIALLGVAIWHLGAPELRTLRFRLAFRDVALVSGVLRESLVCLTDLAAVAVPREDALEGSDALALSWAAAQADLRVALAGAECPVGQANRVQRAMQTFENLVQRDLIGPLQAWALDYPEPLVRSAALDLASTARLLHQIAPVLQELQRRHLQQALVGGSDPAYEALLRQYLCLSGRMGSLLSLLTQRRRIR